MKENSMDLIDKSENTVFIGSECGHGLKKEESSVPTKVCPKCGRELPTTEFYGNRHNKDGLQDKCKDCQREWNREYLKRKKAERMKSEDKVETKKVVVDTQERTMCRVYSEPELAKFTPRQLMQELKSRGFTWDWMLEPQRKIYFDKI